MLKTSAADGQSVLAGLEKRLTGRVPDDADVPGPVRKAARFLLAGGATTALISLFWIVVAVADKNALTDSNGKKLTNAQFTSGLTQTIVFSAIIVGLWVLMARMNRAGHNWARIVASVFCAISTYDTYQLVNSLRGGVTLTVVEIIYIVASLVVWVLGVIAISMLWRSESSVYFRSRSATR